MNTGHIVKSFDDELKQLNGSIAEMGGLAEVQMAKAIEALVKRDTALALEVVTDDERIDALERDIDSKTICYGCIAA